MQVRSECANTYVHVCMYMYVLIGIHCKNCTLHTILYIQYCTYMYIQYCTYNTVHTCTYNTVHTCTYNTVHTCTYNTVHTCTYNTVHTCTYNTVHTILYIYVAVPSTAIDLSDIYRKMACMNWVT